MVCCPYGGVVTLPIIFSMIGVGLTFAYTFTCHFFDSSGPASLGIERGYGPWTIQGAYPIHGVDGTTINSIIPSINLTDSNINYTDATSILSQDAANLLSDNNLLSEQQFCYPWGQYGYDSFGNLFDRDMDIARGFSMASVVLSVLLMFTILFMGCCRFRRCSFYFTGFLCILTGLFSAVTFISMKSTYCQDADTCKMGYSGIICIVSFAWWVLLGFFLMCLNKTPVDERCRLPSVAPDAAKTYNHNEGAPAVTVVTTNAGRDVEHGGPMTVVY